MDLQDQLKNLFPNHEPGPEEAIPEVEHELYVQKEPMICKFEKRKGKPTTIIEGYENFEAQSYNTNFLGLKKKNSKASIKSLKKVTIKTKKTSYFIDFPVHEGFIYGKIYYKNKPIGFAAVKN